MNNNSKRIFKEINILFNENPELKQSNDLHKIIYYGANNKRLKYPYNEIDISSLDIMMTIYNRFNNFYLKNIAKNSKYLELAFNNLSKVTEQINNKDKNYLIIDNYFKEIVENLLDFILEYNKIDNFENFNIFKKILKCRELSDEIERYNDLISEICGENDLKKYMKELTLDNILIDIKEFYNFCENLEF